MKFTINNSEWEIIELNKEEFLKTKKKLDEEMIEKSEENSFVLGFCDNVHHKIYLNKYICKDELKRTLIHELGHCWLWSYGASYNGYSEDALCDTLSSSFEFISDILKKYFDK